MSIAKLIFEFVACMFAVCFFSITVNCPRRALLPVSIASAAGNAVCSILLEADLGSILAYFTGALVVCVCAEVLAVAIKMPASIFVIPGILPLVPGMGIFRTMLALTQSDFEHFVSYGADTLFAVCSIAAAAAMTNFIARKVNSRLRH